VSGDPKFFFGSDSAPHTLAAKNAVDGNRAAAGVFTQPYTTQTVLAALEKGVEEGIITEADVTLEKVTGFLSVYGRKFYEVEDSGEKIVVKRAGDKVVSVLKGESVEVAPFRGGEVTWGVEWQ